MATSKLPSRKSHSHLYATMSSEMLTPEYSPQEVSSPSRQQHATKAQRVLACALCQQRKVRCDRKFPCANCTKAGAQCISATLAPRQRRRRFPERELLDRLRHYEYLLRQNKIPFEPLHPAEAIASSSGSARTGRDEARAPSSPIESRANDSSSHYKAQNFWHAMNRKSQNSANDDEDEEININDDDDDDDDSDSSGYVLREKVVKKAWDTLYDSNDELLFCSRNSSVDLSTLHPNQIQIFKLWQIYLENFDPLLKVTHTPTLQARIIDAAIDLTKIDPPLEALMFSIYSVSIFSLDQDECLRLFKSPRDELLRGYQLGTREALLNCGFLRTGDRDCLTALHFYLMTVKPATDPRSLSSILGATIRIAQRMGIHDENANCKYPALEAELRRRLWWSLVLFDARISEMTEFRLGLLLPLWSCHKPINANDCDFRSDMKTPPDIHGLTSEALFAVVRSEFGNFTRHCSFHLDFINPALKSIAKSHSFRPHIGTDEITSFERMIEDNYLRYCDPQNPLHFMTIWWSRGQLAKSRFIKYLSECSRSSMQQTEAQRDAGISYALSMLKCDTKIMSSKDIKAFRWLIYLNFPFPAYVHVVQDLRKRPLSEHAQTAWNIMSDNCAARFVDVDNRDKFMEKKENPFFKIFAGVVFQAWAAHEAAIVHMGSNSTDSPPRIVTQIKSRMAQMEEKTQNHGDMDHGNGVDMVNTGDAAMSTGIDIASSYGIEQDLVNVEHESFSAFNQQPLMGYDTHNWGWPIANFHPMLGHGW